jgi:hypothetical protein
MVSEHWKRASAIFYVTDAWWEGRTTDASAAELALKAARLARAGIARSIGRTLPIVRFTGASPQQLGAEPSSSAWRQKVADRAFTEVTNGATPAVFREAATRRKPSESCSSAFTTFNHTYLTVAQSPPSSLMQSLVLPREKGPNRCRFFIGNRIHELLNTVVIAGLLSDLPLHRERNVSYECGGLLESTGTYEAYPVTRLPTDHSWCNFDLEDAIAQGELRIAHHRYALKNCDTKARWQSQEGAVFRFVPSGVNTTMRRWFSVSPQFAFGKTFNMLFRFKDAPPSFDPGVLRIGVHLRHRKDCYDGSESIGAILAEVHRLAGKQQYVLLVATDRRHSIDLLRQKGEPVRHVARSAKPSPGRLRENGIDVGEIAMKDIQLLSYAHHLIGSFGSSFTLLIQSLVAVREPEATVVYCGPSMACLAPLRLRDDWHFSLQHWRDDLPEGRIIHGQDRTRLDPRP